MGPIALFDKSFLESLNLDESVWFDHFFCANVCPYFFVETLADLDKNIPNKRTPEQIVGSIANKFPEMHGMPSAFHVNICISNLMGDNIPMTGQIPVASGYHVKVDGKTGTIFKTTPEADAFSRWQRQDFMGVERLYAHIWRSMLSSLNPDEISSVFKSIGIDGKSCKTLEEAKNIADSIVNNRSNPYDKMKFIIQFLKIPDHLHQPIIRRWNSVYCPALIDFAPYATFVLTVYIFFQIALAADLISPDRKSNIIDIAYLFYLPFCMIFVSSDKLHRKCSSHFLRNDQEFVWGEDLKKGLKYINNKYLELDDIIKEKGVMSFASYPPNDDNIIAQIWDAHFPNWRMNANFHETKTPHKNKELYTEITKMSTASPLPTEQVDFDTYNPDKIIIERMVRKKKGNWWQIPKELLDTKK